MAGWVSRRSADRWNNTARIVEAAGAGNRRVPGLYREPRTISGCPDIGLAPGSYPGVAGAAIAAGGTGPILYDGTSYFAKNQSQCDVEFGNLVGLHVSPKCNVFFVPCVCCEGGGGPEPPEGCEACPGPFSICVNGYSLILNYGAFYGDLTYIVFRNCELCPPTMALVDAVTVSLGIWCGGDGVPILYGAVTCNSCNTSPNTAPFTIDLGTLCSDPEAVIDDVLAIVCGLFTNTIPVKISRTLITGCEEECEGEGQEPPAPSECCLKSLWFCINEVSREMPLTGGNETYDATACCDCPGGASLKLETLCIAGIPYLSYFYKCAEITGGGLISLAHFCTSDSGQILTITDPCFIQIQATVEEQICAECLFGPTTGTTEPPPIDP